jgi:hypothetical protein
LLSQFLLTDFLGSLPTRKLEELHVALLAALELG